MNILIVGNGFDLSHYLPTKYDHFMDVMMFIDNYDLKIGNFGNFENFENVLDKINNTPDLREIYVNSRSNSFKFDELFKNVRDKKFVEETKLIYSVADIEIDFHSFLDIKYQLSKNSWYQFFKNHVKKEILSWIDFEQKIEEVLLTLAQFINDIQKIDNSKDIIKYCDYDRKDGVKIRENDFYILDFFKIFDYKENKNDDSMNCKDLNNKIRIINSNFCYGKDITNGFNPSEVLNFLQEQLEHLIEIFNLYLRLVVSKLEPNNKFNIKSEIFSSPKEIYSFNYTNIYTRFYSGAKIEFLHGKCGIGQNIVLGVSELEDISLKKLKAFGFTKYHQKLFKNTDYLFLDEHLKRIKEHKIKSDKERLEGRKNTSSGVRAINIDQSNLYLNLNFYIWGHSLDISDKDYIIDLFSLNDDMDRKVRVTVFHFGKPAKFSLLNNLLSILGKEKVEQWMKNKWLTFEPNPEIDFGIEEESEPEQQAS